MGSCCNGSPKPTTGLELNSAELLKKQPESNSPRLADGNEKNPNDLITDEKRQEAEHGKGREIIDEKNETNEGNNNNVTNQPLDDSRNLNGPRKSKFYYDSLKN